jgi:hypothetical protein
VLDPLPSFLHRALDSPFRITNSGASVISSPNNFRRPYEFERITLGDPTAAIHMQHSRIDKLVLGRREDSIGENISTPYLGSVVVRGNCMAG